MVRTLKGVGTKEPTRALAGRKIDWKRISWRKVEKKVRNLQMRIAKAVSEGMRALVRKLQAILTRSLAARLLAVRRVTTNKGRKTPGTDGVIWYTPNQKMKGAARLKRRRGYQPLPLRRVYLRKKSGKLRPLGIPTMHDRAMQALYAMALSPVAETTADPHSYGFRPYRSCADAVGQCFNALSQKHSSKWVLEADISGCFDNISHTWMLSNIPMDGRTLKAWLTAGYIDKGVFHRTIAGTPQGGIISPILANMALDGLEAACEKAVKGSNISQRAAKVHVIRYADDFVVTGSSQELLRDHVVPAVTSFLAKRGLSLSHEKTRITRVEDGFEFLGQHIRKYGDKLKIRPAKASIRALLDKTRETIRTHLGNSLWKMIDALNPAIRGWAQYHRHVLTHEAFRQVDGRIFRQTWNSLRKRHRHKGKRWLRKHYYRYHSARAWTLQAVCPERKGNARITTLVHASDTVRIPHIKIQSQANPFDRAWTDYFTSRRQRKYLSVRRAGEPPPVTYWWKRPGRTRNLCGFGNA
jgi:RNA-directed DNA polymerase